MPEERFLTIQLHELLMYLGQRGVATILIGAHQGLIGSQMKTPVDASYLADAVILLRYFELRGEVRQAISVVKKRGSQHERTIREFRLDGTVSRRRGAARVPRRAHGRAGLRRTASATQNEQSSVMTQADRRAIGGVLVLAPTTQGRRHDAVRCWRAPASPSSPAPTFDELIARAEGRGAPRFSFPRKRCRRRTARTLRAAAQRAAAVVGSAGARPHAAGRRLGRGWGRRAHARQRDAARAARAGGDAAERRPHGPSGTGAPVPDPRPPGGTRARRRKSLRLADQRKDEFLATLGHELRNPLAPLLTGLQLLQTGGACRTRDRRGASTVMERQITHLCGSWTICSRSRASRAA